MPLGERKQRRRLRENERQSLGGYQRLGIASAYMEEGESEFEHFIEGGPPSRPATASGPPGLRGQRAAGAEGALVSEWRALLLHFKNPAFAAEDEWRLVSFGPWLAGQAIDFRSTALGVVPFFARTPRVGTQLPIVKIWVVPAGMAWGRSALASNQSL